MHSDGVGLEGFVLVAGDSEREWRHIADEVPLVVRSAAPSRGEVGSRQAGLIPSRSWSAMASKGACTLASLSK